MAGTTPVLSKGFLSIVLVVQVGFESRVRCDLLVIFSASSKEIFKPLWGSLTIKLQTRASHVGNSGAGKNKNEGFETRNCSL